MPQLSSKARQKGTASHHNGLKPTNMEFNKLKGGPNQHQQHYNKNTHKYKYGVQVVKELNMLQSL